MQKFDTLSDAILALKSEGYIHECTFSNGGIYCSEKDLNFHPHELKISEMYSGKGNENAVVYTIESPEHGIKGLLINNTDRK